VDVARALTLLKAREPLAKIAKELRVSRSHLRRALDEHQQAEALRPSWPEAVEESPLTQQLLRAADAFTPAAFTETP
jgi:hypothetical protein